MLRFSPSGQSTIADRKGAYKVQGPPGVWKVYACADGYACVTKTVTLKPGRRVFNVALNSDGFDADEVVIRAHRDAPQAVEVSLVHAQIKEIPGTFGDALRAIQLLPGVGSPGDLSGQLLVQGGGPRDNLYLIDSMPWPVPYHLGGLVSTVGPDLLESVSLDEAGYGARWGGALASVLDAQTLAPPTDRLHVDADLSILQASGSLQGPLGLGNATFAITGRRSYFDLVGGLLGVAGLPVYWDSQGVLDFHVGRDNHFHTLVMGSDDAFSIAPAVSAGGLQYDQSAQSVGLSWINTSLRNFESTLTPYVYHTGLLVQFGSLADNNYQTTYGLKEEGVWSAGRWLGFAHTVGVGGDVELSDYRFYGALPRLTSTAVSFVGLTTLPTVPSTVDSRGVDGYGYLQDDVQLNRFLDLTLGLHYDTSTLAADGELGPRISLRWKPKSSDTLIAAWGLYDQAPTALNVNPQYGNPGLEPQSAEDTVLSYEHAFGAGLTGKADAYYKALTDMVVSDPGNPALYSNAGVGDVKGVDLYLKKDLGRNFFAWISYSLSDSDRLNLPAQAWGLYQYDQPDILNLVASYSPNPRWTIGAKLRYNSGDLVLPMGASTYTASSSLPYYLRIDVRAERKWRFQFWTLTSYFEVLNLLNRNNSLLESASASGQTGTVPDLPRLPNIGVEAEY